MKGDGIVTKQIVDESLNQLEIDELGLDLVESADAGNDHQKL